MEHSIVFSHVDKAYGKTVVIKDLNLEIRRGERLILLGPSGCGKTTTLRMMAGFEDISAGELYMDGKVINDVPPGERNIAMVFQSYALFPHLTVWDNITFGLVLQKLPKEEIEKRTYQALDILHLRGQERKKTHELSGGQKQRVALCRALVKQSPFFFLDEPLSNLDAQLRQKARTELVKIHEMFKPTMVYVTHDQIEAMTVADRIAVMNKGKVQQIDTPDTIYHHPANVFVATFIGSPAMNVVKARIEGSNIVIGECSVEIPDEWLKIVGTREEVIFGLRPEAATPKFDETMVKGTVDFMENTGNLKTASLTLADGQTFFIQDSNQNIDLRDVVGFDFDWNILNFFNLDSISFFVEFNAHQWIVKCITRIPIPGRNFINHNISTHHNLLINWTE